MMIYGYARISNKKQNIERQIRNIKAAHPDAVIVREAYTGTTADRPEWNKLVKRIRPGDEIVFDSVSRMSRNAQEGFTLYQELFDRGIELSFLKEPQIDSRTYKKAIDGGIQLTGTKVDPILEGVNKYMLSLAKEQIELAFAQAEKEVEDLHQRTKEGIETARLNGKQIGRKAGTKIITDKSVKAKKIILKHARDFGGELTDVETMKLAGVSKGAYYKYKAELTVGNQQAPFSKSIR